MVNQKRAAIIGATGIVGQKFITALNNHPWIRVVSIHGSSTVGRTFKEARKGFSAAEISDEISKMKVKANKDIDLNDIDLIFSAVPSSIAKKLEAELAITKPVFSISAAFRYDEDVPIYVPAVNASHYKMLDAQKKKMGRKGFVCSSANCTAVGLSISIGPIFEKFGLKNVHMVSMQSISGSGYPGVSAYDISGNVIPHIPKEESKVKTEVRKILGHWDGEMLNNPEFLLDVKCNRVPVLYGHTESVFIETVKETNPDELINAWNSFEPATSNIETELPSAPKKFIKYYHDPYRPQPRIDLTKGNAMSILVGGLRETEFTNGFTFTNISHNMELGAAKGAILNAEYLIANGYLD